MMAMTLPLEAFPSIIHGEWWLTAADCQHQMPDLLSCYSSSVVSGIHLDEINRGREVEYNVSLLGIFCGCDYLTLPRYRYLGSNSNFNIQIPSFILISLLISSIRNFNLYKIESLHGIQAKKLLVEVSNVLLQIAFEMDLCYKQP